LATSVVVEAFAAGLLLGAGVALLLAPKTGAEMRRGLARRLSFDRNEEFAEKVREEGGLPGPFKHLAP
jgi:gas vesicle protein